MRSLLKYLRDYKKECILGPLFKMLEAIFELFVPLVVAAIVDKGIPSGDHGYLVKMGLLLVLLAAVGLSATLFAQYFAAKAATGFAAKLRRALMVHISRLTYQDLDTLGTSTLITRMTSDLSQVQTGVNLAIRLLLRSPFVVFGAMIMAFTIDVKAALVFVVTIPLLAAVVFAVMLSTIPLYKKVQAKLDQVTDTTRENLTGIRVIRAFRRENAEKAKFYTENDALVKIQEKVGRISALMNPGTYVILNGAVIALIYTGAIRVEAGLLTQGAVLALYNWMSQILVELLKLANLIITLTKTAACGNRIAAVLAEGHPSPEDHTVPQISDEKRGCIRFENVTFTYANAAEPAIRNISFSAKRGETIGIIGGTGSGKSTLVNLIPRFYEPDSGTVTVDGLDSKAFPKEALRNLVGVVPQKAVLFQGTIRDNLKWGKADATEEMLHDALKAAQAEDIISAKALGLDEPLNEGGKNLSGGQRQRLTIARALVRQPEFLILDDSASALDMKTDMALRKALRELPQKPTVFIVSQRTSSIRHADRIIVLDEGQQVGCGTHEELLENCPVYAEIHASQMPKGGAQHGETVKA